MTTAKKELELAEMRWRVRCAFREAEMRGLTLRQMALERLFPRAWAARLGLAKCDSLIRVAWGRARIVGGQHRGFYCDVFHYSTDGGITTLCGRDIPAGNEPGIRMNPPGIARRVRVCSLCERERVRRGGSVDVG